MKPVFRPFPILKTSRLNLRDISVADTDEIFLLRTDTSVLRFLDRPAAASVKEALIFINQNTTCITENESILWGITLPPEDTVIGTIAFWRLEKENYRAEIGYALLPDFQGRGIMQEAMEVVLQYGFEQMGLHSVTANINPANQASRKLLEKVGFLREAYFRENYYFNGKFLDSEIYVLLDQSTLSDGPSRHSEI